MSIERERNAFCLIKNNKLLVFTRLGSIKAGMEMLLKSLLRAILQMQLSLLFGLCRQPCQGEEGVSGFLVYEVYLKTSRGGWCQGWGVWWRERRERTRDPTEHTESLSGKPRKGSPTNV